MPPVEITAFREASLPRATADEKGQRIRFKLNFAQKESGPPTAPLSSFSR
jgi:hypothetical protein